MICEDTTYDKNGFVTLENAQFRASLISKCSYDVTLALPKGENYFGHVICTFTLSALPTKPLYLDFRGIKIGKLTINGNEVKENSFKDHHITMAASYLSVGENTVSVSIFNKYRKDGVGLHSYTDSADGE